MEKSANEKIKLKDTENLSKALSVFLTNKEDRKKSQAYTKDFFSVF